MKKIILLGALFLLQAIVSSAAALQFTVTWPPDAAGDYFLPGLGLMEKPSTVSGTYTVEEGKSVRLVGAGFDLAFRTKDGKIEFLQRGVMNGAIGVRFDEKTNTFSFVTVDIQVVVKNCDTVVSVTHLTAQKTSATPTGNETRMYKLIYGHYLLLYGGERIPFSVDSHGLIALENSASGISAQGSTISVEGLPFQVVTGAANWTIHNTSKQRVSGNGPVFLLPGADAVYSFQGGKATVPFFVNNEGLLSLQPSGPYAEVIAIAGSDGTPVAKIMIPDGEARQAARVQQEKIDQALHDKVLASSATASWEKDFQLVDSMKVYDFPEEQLSYPIELPADVKPSGLKLLAFTDARVRSIPFQISTDGKGGNTLFFRTDLPQGATRTFRLVAGFDTAGIPDITPVAPTLKAGANPQEVVLGNDRLLVEVPAGHQDFAGGKPFAQVPAPILGVARTAQPQPWMAKGSFSAPDTLLVDSMDAKQVESGPLFTTYEVTYQLQGGKTYQVTLELRANEPQVRIAESLAGFTPDDAAFLRLNYGKGALDPDTRLAGSGGGYDLYSGDYDKDAQGGKLTYSLGLFTPNGLGVMRSTAFYRHDGSDALLLSMNHIRDWVTSKRALWSSSGAFENIRFFSEDGRKYLTAGLAGSRRFWVLGLIPRDQVKLTVVPGDKALGAGPESRLFNTLTVWSLNADKDRMPDWPEKLDAAPFNTPGFVDYQYNRPYTVLSFDDYKKKYLDNSTYFHDFLNYSSDFGGYSDRAMPAYFAEYALSRATWTPEQRAQIRQILLLLADYCEGDDNQPHHSMLSGHPNFVMDTKQAIPFAVATFPNHPRAKAWRDSYMDFYNEWLEKYDRNDVPDLNTKGGRWTENIACYVGQCFVGLAPDQILLKSYDGTSLTQNPKLSTLLGWMRDSFMSPNDGVRMIPPEGAHSFNFEPGRIGRTVLFDFCAEVAPDAPQISQEMHWIETNGKEGTKPDVHSALFTDYGPVFHHDFGGPNESYAHLGNIFGLDYRWGGAGVVYYGAKNKVWSYNTAETNGDEYNINEISAFNVHGKGLTSGPTDQLLYDFDFAQFYRQPGKDGDAYVARGLMLLRDDFLVIADEVRDPTVPGTFNWVNVYDLPQIYQLKPGAPEVDKISRDAQPVHPGNPDRTAQLRSYSGNGDFLTVVAPAAVTAAATPFGATVNGEYVFASQKPESITEGKAVFSGSYGYARANQLALFQGDKIGLDGFELRRDGGDFGVSADAEQGKIIGRIVGRSGGKISVVPPANLNPSSATVTVDGQATPHTVEQGAIVFPVEIAQKDGLRNYEIQFSK